MARTARRKATPTKKRSPRKTKLSTKLKRMIGWPWFRNWQHALRIGLVMSFWGIILLSILVVFLSVGLPDIRQAVDMDHRPTVILRDRKGVEFARLGDVQGEILRVQDMSPHLVKAVIATEDRRFYKHWGVDPIGILRAVYTNIRSKGVSQGGSTITQQLAKNLFLTPERTLTRKFKEALLALYLERRYTKDDILAAYLNRAYFGAGAYGVDSAARVYFNTSARTLNLEQAAMLAGLLKAPSRYSPDNNPKLTMQRTRTVLGAMVDAGYLRKGAEKMALQPLPKREYNVGGSLDYRYYADWIMGQVEGYIGTTTQNLVIDTTIDTGLQKYASQQLRTIIDQNKDKMAVSQGALITMQPDGAVMALVGGRDYGQSQYNRAVISARQPGSSFKPFIYLAALEAGYTPQTPVTDAPLRVGKYAPQNYDGKYHGTVSMQDAVANSLNTVAVRVAQDVGISRVKRVAQRMGITDNLTGDLSLALGASEVHMLPLTAAYATLANRGLAVEPFGIVMIRTPKGQVLYKHTLNPPTPVLDPNVVAQMNQMLQSVIIYGTGQRAMLDRPAAGKTGTSSNYHDAWFMGYTADYVTGVWVGNDNNAPMKRVTGGSIPAQIWRDVMAKAEAGLPVRPLATASSIETGVTPQVAPDGSTTMPQQGAPSDGQKNMFENLLKNILGDAPQPAAAVPTAQPAHQAVEVPSDMPVTGPEDATQASQQIEWDQ